MHLQRKRRRQRIRAPLRPRAAFTLTEMMVVTGIVLLLAAISVPLFAPLMSGKAVSGAAEIFKQACVNARSRAIQNNRNARVVITVRKGEQSVQIIAQLYDDGAVSSSTATTLTDSNASWTAAEWVGRFVIVVSGATGKRKVQTVKITANTGSTLTVAGWNGKPAVGDKYGIGYIGRKIPLPMRARFSAADFPTEGEYSYTFTPTGAIEVSDSDPAPPMSFSILDLRGERGKTITLSTTTGQVNSEETSL